MRSINPLIYSPFPSWSHSKSALERSAGKRAALESILSSLRLSRHSRIPDSPGESVLANSPAPPLLRLPAASTAHAQPGLLRIAAGAHKDSLREPAALA